MSSRSHWFRSLVAFTSLSTLVSVLLLQVFAQSLGDLAAPTARQPVSSIVEEKNDKDITEELFPYASSSLSKDVATSDLVTAATYPLTVQAGQALEDMSSGTTTLVAASQDDTASVVTSIGFDVWFDGVRFTQFSVNANGLLGFGGTAVNNAASGRTNDFATTTNNPKVAPYWDDLCTPTTGKVHYKVVGAPGNRRLVVEWQNMVTFGTSCTTGLSIGTFQAWIYESSAASTPGAVQFVYGALGANSVTNSGYSIGMGSSSTSFASVTAATDAVSYSVSDNAQVGAIAAGKGYRFTPNVPGTPTSVPISGITQTSMTVNWLDNATTEVGYAIYRSTDGVNFSFLTQTAVNTASFNDTGLLPGTQYFYNVYAVSEGALSGVASSNATTSPAGNISCNGAGGNWSSTGSWAGGVVPAGGDNVTIGSGCTITVDTAAAALSMTVQAGGILEFESAAARVLTVTLAVTNSGTIRSNGTGTVTTHMLSVGTNLTNDGVLDFSTNSDTAGAELRFVGAANNSFSGTGTTTDLRLLTVSKGAGTVTTSSPTLDINLSNMSVRGLTTGATGGFLNTTVFNGIVKFSGTNTLSDNVFQTAAYTIPATAGVWFNNPNFTVAGQNGSPTNSGLLRISNGVFNVGTSSGNSMGAGAGGMFIVEGGTANFAGRLQSTSSVTYSQSGGTVNVCTVGNAATTASFGLTATTNTFSFTGGTIVIVNPNTNTTPLDWSVSTTAVFSPSLAATTLQLGAVATPASTFRVLGATPNISISTGQTMAVGSGTAGGAIFMRGSAVTNNGAIVIQGTGTSSRFDWAGTGPMTYSGTGTFGTAGTSFAGVGMSANGGTTTINAPIFINRINIFSGGFINSGQITLGNGGTSTTVVQVGNSTTPTDAGTFDVSPIYNSGSGGHITLNLRTTTLNRNTGFEINPTRSLATWTVDDNAVGGSLTVTGGDVSVPGTFNLTNGVLVTNAFTVTNNGTVARTAAFVDGNLSRAYSAPGTYTYHVGDNGGYSPVAANVTAGTGSLTVRAVATAQPNIPTPSKALSRHWKLTGTGITSDLTFTYLDPADIPMTATEANFVIQKYDGTFTQPGGSVNTAANTASITGVSSFSDWTLAEPGALVAPGVLALSSATYSANENAGTIAVTVNRTSGTDGAVTVDYSLSGGTATGGAACAAGIDYVNTGGTVSFANGEASKIFNVTLCGDTDLEPDETFNITLSNPTGGATIGSPSSAVATILNDDTPASPVTVTATAGTPGPTGYATLSAAIAAINAGTHQGDIVVSINQSTTEPGTIVINGSGAGSASYTSMIIRPTADGLTVAGPTVQGRGLIELNGADNVDINGDNPGTGGTNRNLTLQNTAANTVTFTSVVRIALAATVVTSANGNTIRNLNLLGSATGRNVGTATTTTGTENTTFGVFVGPGASTTDATAAPAAVTSVVTGAPAASTATNLIVSNNGIATAARAISVNAAAVTNFPGLQITNNSIGNSLAGDPDQVTAVGITASGSADGVVRGNTVWVEGYVGSSAAGHGISVGVNGAFGAFTIENNKVNRVRNNNPATWSAYGINLGGSSNHIVQNNFVSGMINNQTAGTGGFGTTFGAYGIRVGSGTGHKVYHNSVHLYGALPGVTSTDLTAAMMVVATTQTGVDVRNNIFSNQISGGNPTGTRNVSLYLPSGATSAMNLTLNNNAYFAGGDALNRLAQAGTTIGAGEFQVADFDPTSTTPATNLRAYTSTLSAAGTNDNASFATTAPPPFVSNVDLHIPAGTATRLESGGAAIGVALDIDAETRNATTPDIGADEFAGNPAPANDIAASSFVTPANGSTIPTGGLTPQARFLNNGTAVQTSVTVRFRIIDAGMTTIYNQTAVIPTINPLQVVTVTFPATTIATPGAYTMIANAEHPGDANPGNDVINGSFNTVTPVGGTVTVGTGGDFTSLTNPGGLFQQLNTAGISGNTTVNIISDLAGETGAVALNQLAESGVGGYTVTFKPSGAARTITGTGAVNQGVINLNGADRIVFDGSLAGGTDRSLTITNSQTGLSTIFWIKSASASNGATNNTIKNLILTGTGNTTAQTTAGILAGSGVTIGGAAEAPNNNNTVTNNWIYRVQNALYNQGNVGFDQNWTITNNEFGSSVELDKNRFRGMLMGNANNFVISGNNVHGVTNFTGTTGANTGIQIAFTATNGMVVNNRISDIHNLSASGTGAFGMQLGSTTTNNVVIANNFIWDVQANGSATVASNGHGITVNGAVTTGGFKLYFNSINLNTNQVTAGTSAALNVTAAVVAAGALDVRNNIFSNSQTTGTRYGVFSAAAASVFGTINYNDYFAQNVGNIGGTARVTLADWQAATGQDANSKAVDPLFVSATDLHLQAGSPMLASAVAGTGITTDIDGDTRQTPPDIGADEIVTVGTPGVLQFSSATYSVGEAGPTATITVTRTGGSDGTVSAQYASSNGTATGGASCLAGIDYVNTSGTVTFVAGDVSETFTVPICQDAADEPDETVNLALSNPTGGATIGSPANAVLTIVDDDVPVLGSFSINDVRLREGNAGAVNFVFTVSYTGPVQPASVQYATANGTAVSGVDYLPASGTVTFNSPISSPEGLPAPQTATLTVVVNSDVLKEANETFFVNLSNPTGGTIADGQGVGIIIDDDRAYVADFDRDLVSDFSVFRPSDNTWYVRESASNVATVVTFGASGDIAVPGDYDGDGQADFAVWRPSTGTWYRILSSNSSTVISVWGASTDKPVQGDYDGDGKTDLAIFRPSTGEWWILRSSNGSSATAVFGISTDRPIQGDYDGDGMTDLAVYRNGTWYIARSSGTILTANWGIASDLPISGDFDGDGKFDLAIYRNGDWWILRSLTGTVQTTPWGNATDIPAPADYDGDGTTDIAIFRPSTGNWHVVRSSNGTTFGLLWGLNGDVPVPSAYVHP